MIDTQYNIECPACGSKMKKIFIEDTGFNIDFCVDGCGGIFFDNRELEKINNSQLDINQIFKDVENKQFIITNENEVRICPICGTPMAKMGAGVEDVVIDVCNCCGAKFLDNGELQKIGHSNEFSSDMVDELIQYLYHKELNEMLGNNAGKKPVTGKLRTFFEKLVFKGILK